MFWRFGGYANISTIDTILEKENFQLEELLDENDLIQELKSHNAKLVEYLREPAVLEKLLEYVVAPKLGAVATPDDEDEDEGKGKGLTLAFTRPRASSRATDNGSDEVEKRRNRYAYVAAELLSSDNWSIYEALMENRQLLRNFWHFLKRPTPLDPLQASYFTKVNESLFDKKTDEMLDLLKSLESAVPDMLEHVDSPMIMDLLLKIISLERTESGHGIVEWLYTQDVIPTLLSFLGPEHSWSTQTSAGDFMKAIITVSANASQNEQTCIGPNELTRQLVSKPCVEQLIKYMLGGGNPLTVGVGIVIEVIRKNNSDYDPEGADINMVPSSRDPIYLGTLLRLFAQNVPNLMELMSNAPAQKERLQSTFAGRIEPLGFDRFKTCELMAELLHCSNMGLLNEVGSEELIAVRDKERQRLREEGRLVPSRGDEHNVSNDELTMRSLHAPPVPEARKLEVTNNSAEDDGFEEVTHVGEDDTPNGVEELPELPANNPEVLPTSSFLDKDEDDFVDEPLSSPRLHVRDVDKGDNDSSFEEPDLIVPPLSPTKLTASEPAKGVKSTTDEETEHASESGITAPAEEKTELKPETDDAEQHERTDDAGTLGAPVPTQSNPDKAEQDAEEKIAEPESLSPRPEDTPAPLFSGQSAPLPSATPTTEASQQSQQPDEKEELRPSLQTYSTEETGDTSIIVGRSSELITPIDDTPLSPVVGDYLKMQFMEYRVVPTILGFFFAYPWNNFLHNVVYDIVQQVFNGPMDRGYNPTLAISLFEAADITNRIINGQRASEESQAQSKTRMGYMGHLTLIAEEVVKFTERHPPELLSESVLDKVMAQDWISYVEGALAETRERDNAILGGVRPEVAMNNRAGAPGLAGVGLSGLGSFGLGGGVGGGGAGSGSNFLAEAGLNGGSELQESSGNGIGPFAISAGTLMSGFGSSSDEDEDEEQESEEDVNNEFRAYTDSSNSNQSTAMNPPSIPPPPPPPPPLNIPPSRARLQLAARLAMNKRNAAAAAANGGDSNTFDDDAGSSAFSLPNRSSSDRLRNPFADGDDDEEEEEEGKGDNSSGSDDDGEGGRDDGDDGGAGSSSSSWNRGSWWRGVVRSARRGGRRRAASSGSAGDRANYMETERFGDGRDDSDSDGPGLGDEVDEDIDDEEFGDFTMPENNARTGGAGNATVSGIDPARERILLKPLPVHPSVTRSGVSPFGSLWPFSSQGFGTKEKRDDKESASGEVKDADGKDTSSDEKTQEEVAEVQEPVIVGEDGQKINRAVEAKRRTSIEDPDEDEVDVGEEILVGRAELA